MSKYNLPECHECRRRLNILETVIRISRNGSKRNFAKVRKNQPFNLRFNLSLKDSFLLIPLSSR